MMQTPGKSLADSDEDLAGFLAGLRKRYNLDTSPLPAASPLSRLAFNTLSDGNITAGLPELHNPGSIASSPTPGKNVITSWDPAGAGAAAVAGPNASNLAEASEELPANSALLSTAGGPFAVAAATLGEEQHQTGLRSAATAVSAENREESLSSMPLRSPPESPAHRISSESGSCSSPRSYTLLQHTESQLAIAAGEPGATPTDMPTGGAVAAVGTPHTTAAMRTAYACRLQEPAADTINAVTFADLDINEQSAWEQQEVFAGPAAGATAIHSIQLQTSVMPAAAAAAEQCSKEECSSHPAVTTEETASSTDFDSPSIKKPLYDAFIAAGAPARSDSSNEAKSYPAADAAGSQEGQSLQQQQHHGGTVAPTSSGASTPRSSVCASPRNGRGRVSFSMQETVAAAAAANAQQQRDIVAVEQQQQQHEELASPGSMWHRRSTSPTRSVLKHDSQDVQLLQQQQQQQQGLQQHVWHHNELFQGSSSGSPKHLSSEADFHPASSNAFQEQQQQQYGHEAAHPAEEDHEQGFELTLRPLVDHTDQQFMQQQEPHSLHEQLQEQQHADEEWQQQQQQLVLEPPRSSVLQDALQTLQCLQGSLAQLQSQSSNTAAALSAVVPDSDGDLGTHNVGLVFSAITADIDSSDEQEQAQQAVTASTGVQDGPLFDEAVDPAGSQSFTTAAAAAAAACVDHAGASIESANMPKDSQSNIHTDPFGVVGGFREWGSAGDGSLVGGATLAAAAATGVAAVAHLQVAPAAAVNAAVDWLQLSNKLSMAGFGALHLHTATESVAAAAAAAAADSSDVLLPELGALHSALSQVLREYQRRDGLIAQLMQDRDELRREVSRNTAEMAKAERNRSEAVRTAERLKAELGDVRSLEIPALESKHKEAQAKLSSEVAKLKHAVKEAEQAAAAAKEAAASAGLEQLQQQLQDAIKERERFSLECERLASEVARQKPYIRDLERAAAAARTTARQSDDAAALIQRQMGQMRQQQQQEVDALAAELNKARHAVRDAEQQLAALKSEAASRSDTTQDLMKQLATERAQHEDQTAHLSSELQKLRQQLLALQQATAKAEAAAKSETEVAVYSSKQLAVLERSHNAEIAKLTAELKQARELQQLTQGKLQQAEAAAVEQAAASNNATAEARNETNKAAALAQELDRVKSGSRQQLQLLSEQFTDAKRALADTQQQLVSTQNELRRLRAAAGLADGSAAVLGAGALAVTHVSGTTAAAGGDGGVLRAEPSSSSTAGFSVQPPAAAKVVSQDLGMEQQQQQQDLMEITLAPGKAVDKDNSSSSSSSFSGGTDEHPAVPAAATAVPTARKAAAAVANDADLAAALARAVRAEAAAAEAEGSLVALRYKMLTLEAAGARLEREVEQLRDRLGDKVIKEERRLARDKAAYARIRQAYASTAKRQQQTPAGLLGGGLESSAAAAAAVRRAAAGAVAAAARELRPVELVGIYEGQKEALEKELVAAKAEVRVLSGQLRDAQNLLIVKDRAAAVAAAAAAGLKGGAAAAAAAGLADPAAAVAAQRKAAELTRELCSVRAEAASALREAAKRLAQTEAQLNQLKADNEDLQQEIASRPTHQEHRQLKREIDILQRKIATLKRQAAAAVAGGTAAAGEDALALTAAAVAADDAYANGDAWPPGETAAAAAGVRGLGGKRSVAAAVARDRAIARLGLGVVEEYPRDVLVDLIQDVCVILELRDATLLVPNMRKMAAVLGAVPKLEAFVAQVCEACFRQGQMFVPAAVQHTMNPGTVPQVLQHWLGLLQQGEQLRQLTQQLQQLLAQRCTGCDTDAAAAAAGSMLAAVRTPIADAAGDAMQLQQLQAISRELVSQVQQLLQVESEAIAAADLLSAAKGVMANQPEGLLQQLLSHIQQLFDVAELEALPAAMNKVYIHYSELANFFKAVSSLLCLPADAGPQAAMAAISSLLQQTVKPPSKVQLAAAQLRRASPTPGTAAPSTATNAAAAAANEAEQALQALLGVLGVSDVQQAARVHQDMKQRLDRLDEVLPRYQRLASQLYERLRVVSLDDILPALDAALAAS